MKNEQKIRLITDSASDIPTGRAQELGIDLIPIPIAVDGQGYLEGVDFSPREFYTILQQAKDIPTTSQISPLTYCDHFSHAFTDGCTDAILVSFTSTASSTFQRATEAREMFYQNCPEAKGKINIRVLDSKMFSVAYGYAVMNAAKMANSGRCTEEIIDYLQNWFDHVEAYFTCFSFEYIKKSGRISCASAVVGEALGIRPVIQIKKGEMKIFAKVRGNHAVIKKMAEIVEDRIEPDSPCILLRGSFDRAEEELSSLIEPKIGRKVDGIFDVGASVSINSGPQMIGVGFLSKQ